MGRGDQKGEVGSVSLIPCPGASPSTDLLDLWKIRLPYHPNCLLQVDLDLLFICSVYLLNISYVPNPALGQGIQSYTGEGRPSSHGAHNFM